MRKEFTEEDYIKSFEYQYWPRGHNDYLPEGERYLFDLADLNGRLLRRHYQPLEREDFNQLSAEIREARVRKQLAELKKLGLLKRLPVIRMNGRFHP